MDTGRVYWIDGTQYSGSQIAGTGTKCIKATVSGPTVEFVAVDCTNELHFLCENVAPPGKSPDS